MRTSPRLLVGLVAGALLATGVACFRSQTRDRTADGHAGGDPEGLLAVGTKAPDFSVVAHDGTAVTLSKLAGRTVVLYFYPHDDTTGCTREACDFRDSWDALKKRGVVVLGVSTQDSASHQAFAAKYGLPFQLLPDDKKELARAYHVPLTLGMAHRVTYLIGPDGSIVNVWPNVTPAGHAREILAALPPGG